MRELQGCEIAGCRINIEWSKESGRYHRNAFFRESSRSMDRERDRNNRSSSIMSSRTKLIY